jgi:hypothetical protein
MLKFNNRTLCLENLEDDTQGRPANSSLTELVKNKNDQRPTELLSGNDVKPSTKLNVNNLPFQV